VTLCLCLQCGELKHAYTTKCGMKLSGSADQIAIRQLNHVTNSQIVTVLIRSAFCRVPIRSVGLLVSRIFSYYLVGNLLRRLCLCCAVH